MIHELRIYTLKPGKLNEYLHLAETKVNSTRGDRFGRLVGFWYSDFGVQNRVFHIWEYADLNARQQGRIDLFQEQRWLTEFIAHVWPIIELQEVYFLELQSRFVAPATQRNVYEMKFMHARTGYPKELAQASSALPLPAGSTRVVQYTGISPLPNQVIEIVAHQNLAARLALTQRSVAVREFLEEQEIAQTRSELLLPIEISPLQ
jgi:hypothetical protein